MMVRSLFYMVLFVILVLKEIAGLTGGLSAILTGVLTGLSEEEISSNVFNGQRLGKNAVENNLLLYVHGTWSNKDTFSPEFKEGMERLTGDDKELSLEWSGDNTKEARTEAAQKMKELIENYEFEENEPLNVIAHSHGGNVTKEFSNLVGEEGITGKNGTKPDKSIASLFATPNRKDYIMKDNVFDDYYNIYNKNDKLTQDIMGGTNTDTILNILDIKKDTLAYKFFTFSPLNESFLNTPYVPVSKPRNPSQLASEADVINIEVKQDFGSQLKNHTEMKNPETVNTIYNYISNKQRERQNDLDKYNNIINFINKNRF